MVISDVSSVGDINKYAVLKEVRDHDGITREEISRILKLSVPAVTKNINSLLQAGIIYEKDIVDTSKGRKPSLLYCNYDFIYIIGAMIMPDGIRVVLCDYSGKIIKEVSSNSEIEISSLTAINNLLNSIDEVIESVKEKNKIKQICLASPGAGEGAIEFNLLSDYQKDWINIDLRSIIYERFKIPVVVRNDVEMSLIGERWKGSGKDTKNLVLCKYGEGFASRAMIDDHLFVGENKIAGDIGLYVGDYDEGKKRFSLPGSLENKLCLTLEDRYTRYGGETDTSKKKINLKWLIDQENKGDKVAGHVIHSLLRNVAVVITNSVIILNPKVVILSGYAAYLNQEDLDIIIKFVNSNCPYPPEIRISYLKDYDCLYGCIKTAIDMAEDEFVEIWKG